MAMAWVWTGMVVTSLLFGIFTGNLDAVANALKKTDYKFNYKFVTYSEHAISGDSNSKAAAYICIEDEVGRQF